MDILIWDWDQCHSKRVEEFCVHYLIKKNKEARIIVPKELEELGRRLGQMEAMGTFFLDAGGRSKQKARPRQEATDIRIGDQSGYIVLMGDDIANILHSISPAIRPAGCLLKPAKEREVMEVLETIWKDYESAQNQREVFRFQIQGALYAIPCQKILCFESCRKKVILRTNSQEFAFYDSLGRIEESLPDGFLRVHKSYIVNLAKIERVDYANMTIYLEEDCVAFLSRNCRKILKEYVSQEGMEGKADECGIPDNETGDKAAV